MKTLNYQSDKNKIEEIMGNREFNIEKKLRKKVKNILLDVKNKGEKAVLDFTAKFDDVELKCIKVKEKEIEDAFKVVEEGFLESLNKAATNIKEFHEKQKRKSWFDNKKGKMTGQLINPIKRVGCYVPGGGAAYPSSALMTVIPAKVAGVEEIVVTTPPGKDGKINPYTLVTLKKLGIEEIYKIGGAQAIAALAYGTESIEKVMKIVGPGNIFVTIAKKEVYGKVDIDMLAGPSEVMILADSKANPSYLAADLLSQAEHDPRAISILASPSIKLIKEVKKELDKQLSELSREKIARQSLKENGLLVEVKNLEKGLELVNDYGPEHFELAVEDPLSYLGQIENAGAIFLGEYSPEPLGDYYAGPNHVLPTGGTAKFSSPLTTDDFIKKSSLIYYSQNELEKSADDIIRLAKNEGLDAHAKSIEIRKRGDQNEG
ncbi:MAG: histidinol dehydrogenase [Bacillota bacterium]